MTAQILGLTAISLSKIIIERRMNLIRIKN